MSEADVAFKVGYIAGMGFETYTSNPDVPDVLSGVRVVWSNFVPAWVAPQSPEQGAWRRGWEAGRQAVNPEYRPMATDDRGLLARSAGQAWN
jgi:hypothetical protein